MAMTLDAARKSCFVLAPYDVHLGGFLEALRREQIEPFFISDFLKVQRLAISDVRSAFRSVDLVIALLFRGKPLDNVFFEIGMAIGLGRPTILFASSPVDLPNDLRALQINHVDLSNPESTIPAIKKWLEPKQRNETFETLVRTSAPQEKGRSRLRGAALRDQLQRTRNVWAHAQDSGRVRSELSRLLTEIGWTVVEVRPSARNQAPDLAVWINNAGSEEIDVAFFNNKQKNGFPFLEYLLLVECKNWSAAVGAIHVREFATKLEHRACAYGVLVAANGITGNAQDRTAAHDAIRMALAVKGISIIVITRVELQRCADTAQVVELFKLKLCELTVAGSTFA